MGEVDLFFHAQIELADAERSLLEALTVQLAGAMENLRLDASAVEAAVSQERSLLARELHDSIAQSLAFLKIQVQLMRDALASGDAQRVEHVLGEIDARRARKLRRRARIADALPHPHQRRGHRTRAADHAAQVRAPDRPEGEADDARPGPATVARHADPGAAHRAGSLVERAQTCPREPGVAGRRPAAALARRGARRRPGLPDREGAPRRNPRRPAHHGRARRTPWCPAGSALHIQDEAHRWC